MNDEAMRLRAQAGQLEEWAGKVRMADNADNLRKRAAKLRTEADGIDALGGGCLIVGGSDTRESLMTRGLSSESADEVMAFRDYLEAIDRGEAKRGEFQAWRRRRERRNEG